MSAKKNKVLIVVVLVALLAGGGLWWQRQQHRAGPADRILLAGTVEARQIRPGFLIQGRISALHVDEGMAVTRGTLLAELDAADYRLELRQATARRDAAAAALALLEAGSRPEEIGAAEATLAEAEARLGFATDEVQRLQELATKRLAAREELDNARMELRVARAVRERARQNLQLLQAGPRQQEITRARAELEAAAAAVATARQRLDHTRLAAPADGVVSQRLVEVGSVVSPGTPVFEIDSLRHPWVRAYLNERDLPRVRLGQAVTIRVDGLPGRSFSGRLAFISPRAEFTPKTVETRALRVDLVYRIKVDVDNPDGSLKLGMPVDLVFATR